MKNTKTRTRKPAAAPYAKTTTAQESIPQDTQPSSEVAAPTRLTRPWTEVDRWFGDISDIEAPVDRLRRQIADVLPCVAPKSERPGWLRDASNAERVQTVRKSFFQMLETLETMQLNLDRLMHDWRPDRAKFKAAVNAALDEQRNA